MTPYLAALDRGRHHRRRPPLEHHRRPESIANNNPLKRSGDGAAGDLTIARPAAAAPPRRPEQVGLRQSSLESARASRARVGSE